jgi:hypothetical protein
MQDFKTKIQEINIYVFSETSKYFERFAFSFSCVNRLLGSHRAVVLLNLCIALIIANIIFIAGSDKTSNKVCVIQLLSDYCCHISARIVSS